MCSFGSFTIFLYTRKRLARWREFQTSSFKWTRGHAVLSSFGSFTIFLWYTVKEGEMTWVPNNLLKVDGRVDAWASNGNHILQLGVWESKFSFSSVRFFGMHRFYQDPKIKQALQMLKWMWARFSFSRFMQSLWSGFQTIGGDLNRSQIPKDHPTGNCPKIGRSAASRSVWAFVLCFC